VAILFPNLINPNDLQLLDNEWRLLRNTQQIQSNGISVFWKDVKKIGNE
jgi:hypothetical protein